MLKYLQTKMLLVGNILIKVQMKFGDFWSCASIFLISLQSYKRNRKGNKNQKKTYLARPTSRPTWRPSTVLARASQLLRPRQAGRVVTPTSASSPRRHLLAASPPDALDVLHVVPPTQWTRPLLPCFSPSLSHRHGRRCRAHAAVNPRPSSPPCCSTVSCSSATSSSSAPPSHASPEACERPHRARLQPSAAQIAIAAPLAPARPRPHRQLHRNRGEPS